MTCRWKTAVQGVKRGGSLCTPFWCPQVTCTAEITPCASDAIFVLTNPGEWPQQQMPRIFDIEEAVAMGKKHRGCAYYATHALASEAQLVLCPYNFLVDPVVRGTTGIQLQNSVRNANFSLLMVGGNETL